MNKNTDRQLPIEEEERELLAQALAALQASTGGAIRGELATPTRPTRADALLVLRRGQQATSFAAEIKRTVRPSHLTPLKEQLHAVCGESTPLLVTRHVGAPLARQLCEQGLSFLDTAGNAHLNTPDWFVLISGNPPPSNGKAESPLGATTWQVAFVLLQDPDSFHVPMRELAIRAGVSLGSASLAIRALHQRGWIRSFGRQGHPVSDFAGLLLAWEFGYVDRLAGKLRVGRAQPIGASTVRSWAALIEPQLGPERALLGGELAAERLGLDILASTAAVHVRRWDAETMKALRLVPSKSGPIAVLQTFGSVNADPLRPHLADPLLIRAEMATIQDERLQSARDALRELIESRWKKR